MPKSTTRKNRGSRLAPKDMAAYRLAMKAASRKGLEAMTKARQGFMRTLNQTMRRKQIVKKMNATERREMKKVMATAIMNVDRNLRRSLRLVGSPTTAVAPKPVPAATAPKVSPYLYPSILAGNTRGEKAVDREWRKLLKKRCGATSRKANTPEKNMTTNENAEFLKGLSGMQFK